MTRKRGIECLSPGSDSGEEDKGSNFLERKTRGFRDRLRVGG